MSDETCFKVISMIVDVIKKYPDHDSMGMVLQQYKKNLIKELHSARDTEGRLKNYTMEYLMSQRIVPKAIDEEKAMEDIETITLILNNCGDV